ncbi:MAG: hypothetical protein HKN19_10790, partial [Halioglobus sp.]|nr:hypothetical protein [Halioglobus sp.]
LRAHVQDAEESSPRVEAALRALGPKARDVLGLRFYSDLSLEAISAAFGISLSAAKMRLYRALEQFEKAYALSA